MNLNSVGINIIVNIKKYEFEYIKTRYLHIKNLKKIINNFRFCIYIKHDYYRYLVGWENRQKLLNYSPKGPSLNEIS